MKKSLYLILVFTFVISTVLIVALSAWAGQGPEIAVTVADYADHPDIAIDSNGNIHIVYSDDTGTSAREIWYTMLDSTGSTLIEDTRITVETGDDGDGATRPAIVVDSNNRVHIIWRDSGWDAGNSKEVTYSKLNPYADDRNGDAADPATITVVDDTRLSNDGDWYIYSPRMAVDSNDNIHIIWGNYDDSNVYYMKLDSNGNVLIAQASIRPAANYKSYTDIAVDSTDNLHIVFADDDVTSYDEVYYMMINGSDGSTMIDATMLTDDDGEYSKWTRIAVDSEDNVHIVFQDQRGAHHEIYYTKLDPALDDQNGDVAACGNITVIDDTALTADDGNKSRHPAIPAGDDGDQIHIIWEESSGPDIYYMALDTNGNTLVSGTALTNSTVTSTAYSTVPNLDMENNKAHIVWCDGRNGNYDIYYTSYQRSATEQGLQIRVTYSQARADQPDVAIDSNGNTHIVYCDDYNTARVRSGTPCSIAPGALSSMTPD